MPYTLGIDIGTSKVAAVILDDSDTEIAVTKAPSDAEIPSAPSHAEQNVQQIFKAVQKTILELPQTSRSKVRAIGLTGQMHGALLWNPKREETSPLFTWQDQRCLRDGFLQELHSLSGDTSIRSGYGCATLAWLSKFNRPFLRQFSRASTIHDYLACQLCELSDGVTDPSDAASWGFFDIRKSEWQLSQIETAGIDPSLLPRIVLAGTPIGQLSEKYAKILGLQPGISVMAPLGDNQASLFATLQHPLEEVALTLGTGGQLSVILDKIPNSLPPTAEVRPYLDGMYAIVAASLAGGSAMKTVMRAIRGILSEFGVTNITEDTIYKTLNDRGLANFHSPLRVSTSFYGERHDPERRGSILGIDSENLTLGNLAAASARNVIQNLASMLPYEFWRSRERVVGSGNGLRRLPLVQEAVKEVFAKPLLLRGEREEAACGAAALSNRNISP